MVYGTETIPAHILDTWQQDFQAETRTAAISTVGSSCYLSLSRSQQTFLEAWRDVMDCVLPTDNIGVTNKRRKHYHQLDESVLNAAITFVKDAPTPTAEFRLNKDQERFYVHFISQPKPWIAWTSHAMVHYETYVFFVEEALRRGYHIPNDKRSFALHRTFKLLFVIVAPLTSPYYKIRKRLLRLLKK